MPSVAHPFLSQPLACGGKFSGQSGRKSEVQMLARWTWVHYCPSRQRWGRSAWTLTNSHWPGLESRVPVLAVILVGHLPQNLNVALHGFNLEIPNRGLQGEVLHWVSSSGHVLFWQRWSWSTLREFAQCESSEPRLIPMSCWLLMSQFGPAWLPGRTVLTHLLCDFGEQVSSCSPLAV